LNGLVEKAFELADNIAVDPWFRFPMWKPESQLKWDLSESQPEIIDFESRFFETLFPHLIIQPVGLEERYLEQQESRTLVRKTEKATILNNGRFQRLQFSLVNQGLKEFYGIEESRGASYPLKSKETLLDALMRKANRLKNARSVQRAQPGKYILNGVVVSALLKSVEPLLWGNLAGVGKSSLSNKIEKTIFSDKVTLVDDGLYDGGEGTQFFDLEGAPSQQTRLVDSGVLKTFLHDASSSARYNRASTGNLILGENNNPSVGVTNLYVIPSEFELMELFNQMKDGIYVECLEKTGKDLTRNGKLEFLGHGWRVHNGEPVEPLSHIFLTVDPIEIFKQVTLVANDLEFWGRYGSPSVFLEKMPLSVV
jgi:predicted Zn-dependent protease